MTAAKPVMKMPELPVFGRLLATGFIGAEIWRSAFYVGTSFSRALSDVATWTKAGAVVAIAALCIAYALKRGANVAVARMARSGRFDLLIAVGVGVWVNDLASPFFAKAHAALKSADPHWALPKLGSECSFHWQLRGFYL